MTAAKRVCHHRGRLVGPQYPIPQDPSDYVWDRPGPIYGCNKLVCRACGRPVRQMLGVKPAGPLAAPGLSGSAQALLASGALVAADDVRWYACACSHHTEGLFIDIVEPEHDDFAPRLPPWACGGHPPVKLPEVLDGVTLAVDTDWGPLVRSLALSGAPALAPDWTRQYRVCWLQRLYHLLVHLPETAAHISTALADLLTADEPEARSAATDFFRRVPAAPGGERVAAVAAQDGRVLYCGQPNPLEPGADASEWLLLALGERIELGRSDGGRADPAALEAARQAVLWPARAPLPLLRTLSRVDTPWLADHAAEILAATPNPTVLGDLLYVLEEPLGARLADVAAELATVPGIERSAFIALADDLLEEPARGAVARRLSPTA